MQFNIQYIISFVSFVKKELCNKKVKGEQSLEFD